MTSEAYAARVSRRAFLRSPIAGSIQGRAATLLTQLLLIALLPRILGPADYGLFAATLALVTLGSVSFALGTPVVMARFVPAAPRADRPALTRALVEVLARRRAAQLAAVSLVAIVLAVAFPERFPQPATAFVVLALALGAAASLAFQAGLGLGRTELWSFRFAAQNALLVPAVIALHALWGSNGALGGIVVASGGALVLGAVAISGPLRRAARGFPLPPGATRFGTLNALSGLLVQASQRGAVILVALLAGSTEAGFAALAIGAALAVAAPVGQVFFVQLPSLAERWATHAMEAEAAARRLAWQAPVVVVPLALAAAVSVDLVVPWLWGQRFGAAEDAFAPALALIPLAPLAALATQVAALRLQPAARLQASAVGAVAFLVTALTAVPAWGAVGASAALLAATVAALLVSARAFPVTLTPTLVAASLASSGLVLAAGLAA